MKKVLYTTAVMLTLCLVLSNASMAQQKQGYVDTDYLLSQLPEYESIQQQLDLMSQEWRDELKEMQQEIDHMKEDFAAKEILYTDEIRKERQREIQQKIQQRRQYLEQKFGSRGEYFQQQRDLLEPLQRRIFEAIASVAERENFDFVFDRSQKNEILFAREEWNLNDEVLLEMGLSPEESSN